jgi:hypothetical protein
MSTDSCFVYFYEQCTHICFWPVAGPRQSGTYRMEGECCKCRREKGDHTPPDYP